LDAASGAAQVSRLREMHRKDAVHAEIVSLARKLGIYWFDGPPLDGFAAIGGKLFPVEIKDPKREGHADEFTPQQINFFNACRLASIRFLVWRKETDVYNDWRELK
jgi:hypothetical protein